jgi:hypothetical protein
VRNYHDQGTQTDISHRIERPSCIVTSHIRHGMIASDDALPDSEYNLSHGTGMNGCVRIHHTRSAIETGVGISPGSL